MNILVTYDVKTETPEGRKRLRRVAKTCLGYGQRVQWSVFECSLDPSNLERFKMKLLKIISMDEDSLRIYKLHGDRENAVEAWGLDRYHDFSDTLIL